MLCQKCNKKVATVFISTIVNGKNTQMYLCTDCAKELHDNMNPDIKIPFPINDILTNMELSEDTINEWINEFKDMEDKGQIEELVQHEIQKLYNIIINMKILHAISVIHPSMNTRKLEN